MTMPALALPTRTDVLVIGAGPAGSACALALARNGTEVLLVDQHHFPRDKVCGDGLIPDTHAALKRLGVYDEVAALAQPVQHVRCVAPRGGHVDVPGRLSVLPRKQLDHVLVRAAERAGARLLTPLRFEAPLLDGERVVGGRFHCSDAPDGSPAHDIHARWVVLATGAVPQALSAAGVCERHTPSGTAVRAYVKHEGMTDKIAQLQVVWHRRLRGGYGWVFPAPGGVFNIGAGLTESHLVASGKGRRQGMNLRDLFDAFCEVHPPAAELMRGGEMLGPLKGAPLRFSLRGAAWSRPGMLVAGEAAGTTYAFTGEGIGKALESGLMAADALRGTPTDEAAVLHHYENALRGLQPQFALYDSAGRVNRHPWLADLVVWRARRSPRILRRLAGVLDETQSPARLFTLSGVTKLIFE
jgi:menaquinone-9 beta-reductase